jgi:hypothetical protein
MTVTSRMKRLLSEAEQQKLPALSVLRAELKAIAEMPDAKGHKQDPGLKLSKIKKTDEEDDFDIYKLTVGTTSKVQGEALKAWVEKYGWAVYGHEFGGGRWDFVHILELWPKEHVSKPYKHFSF